MASFDLNFFLGVRKTFWFNFYILPYLLKTLPNQEFLFDTRNRISTVQMN